MQNILLTTTAVAGLARQDKTKVYSWFSAPECQPWLPPKTGIGESRYFTPLQAICAMIHSDLTRWGLSVPFAARLTSRIAEIIGMAPDTTHVVVAFRENGASIFFGQDEDGGRDTVAAPDHAPVCGPERFRLTIALAPYWAAVREAGAADAPRVIGGSDEG